MWDIKTAGLLQLNIEDIYPGMVLNQDVYSTQGALLAHAGMLLTEESYQRLVRAGINILDNSEYNDDNGGDASGTIPANKMEEFNEFKSSYEDKEKEVGQCLMQIGNGETVDLDKTFALTDNIIAKLERKNDVFLYLEFMKDFDNHTFSHCSNVSMLCNVFASWLGLDAEQTTALTVAGILHDVGKTLIPLDLLNKTGKLTREEFEIIKNHSALGYKLLMQQKLPKEIQLTALQHHEKIDGSGYPFGVDGSRINYYSKIVAICDIYDAMTSTRCYHEKICPFEVIRTFETGVYGVLDTELLFLFLNNIAFVYLNSNVLLSDGREAEVVFIPEHSPSKPMVRTPDGKIINLVDHPEVTIQKIM